MKRAMYGSVATFLVGLSIGWGIALWYAREDALSRAVAVVYPLQGSGVKGVVTFERRGPDVLVHAVFDGLTPGSHGLHIHEHGDARCQDGMCTGGHFNPTNQLHGGRTTAQRHIGDFGNVVADETGHAELSYVAPRLHLTGPQGIVGRAVIVHADIDDQVSQPSGNAGARIGCGIIGIAS